MIKQIQLQKEKNGLFSSLSYQLQDGQEMDRALFEQLKTSKISCLARCTAYEREGDFFLRYEMVPNTNLSMLFTGTLTKEKLIKSLTLIVDGMLETERMGLKLEQLVLNPQHIYVDSFSNRLIFIYLPVKNNVFEKVSIKEFMAGLLLLTPYDLKDDLAFFVRLHNELSGPLELDLRVFKTKLRELADGSDDSIPMHTNFYNPSGHGTETPAAEEEGTTTLGIHSGSPARPFLLAKSTHEKIAITQDFFKIGRDPAQTDYTSHNGVIGRVHAHIITANGEYFFEDNQSRNGSFVNGKRVIPMEKVKIRHEDVIRLANEEFEFRLF